MIVEEVRVISVRKLYQSTNQVLESYLAHRVLSSLSTGGDHCVSNPVIQSSIINEGDEGSLEWAINSLIDDNGANFMTVDSIPNKQSAVTISISGMMKEK